MTGCLTRTGDHQVADTLILVLTRGVTLAEWRRTGLLDREFALYREHLRRGHVAHVCLVTDGDDVDDDIATSLGARRVASDGTVLASVLTELSRTNIGCAAGSPETRRFIVKSNQFEGASVAAALTRALRDGGLRQVAFVARGGYPYSRFAGWRYGTDSPQARAAALEEQAACAAADLVVGTTTDMVEDLAWRYALSAHATAVVPNYIDGAAVQEALRRNPNRDSNLVLCAGRLEPQKRVDRVIRAMALLPRGRGLRLEIVGDGSELDRLRELAASLGVPVMFRARMPHQDLLNRMAGCAVFVQASDIEGHPKTVLEAMATGAPVLVTDAPGLGCVVRPDFTGIVAGSGLLSRRGNDESALVGALADQLARLLNDGDLRRRVGACARDEVLTHSSLENIAEMEAATWRHALDRAATVATAGAGASIDPVRFDPQLVHAAHAERVRAWASVLGAFQRRLQPAERAAFLLALDDPLYQMQGQAAVAASQCPGGDGLHPKHRLMRYHDFFVERIGRGERVIDLGCGVGALALAIAVRADGQVTGVDWTEANLTRARSAATAAKPASMPQFVLGDITSSRVEGRFDVLVMSNVLEHITNRVERLCQWREWYGFKRVLIRVPAFDREWRVPYKKELGVEWRLDDTHETEYTEDSLRLELGAAGMTITTLIARWGEYWCAADIRDQPRGAGPTPG